MSAQIELPVAVAVVVDNQVSVEEQIINIKPKRKYVRKAKVAEEPKKNLKMEDSEDEDAETTTNDEVENIEREVAFRQEQEDEVAEQIQNLQNEDVVDDIEEQVKELQQKQKEIQDRLKLLETAKKVKKDISDYRKTLIDNRKKSIKTFEGYIAGFQADIEKAKGELEAIDGLQDDELSEMIMTDPNVIRETQYCHSKVKKSAVRKTPAKKKVEKKEDDDSSLSSGEKSDKSKAYFQRKEQWNYIPQGTKLELIYNKSKRIYTKKGDGLVDEEGKEYKSLNDAVKKYKLSIGDTKGFGSAWSLFKVVD